jgi:hypothetical protein
MDLNFGRNLKQALSLSLALLIVVLLVLGMPKYWGDFTGMDEASVIRKLGAPLEIRPVDEDKNERRTLIWQESLEVRLYLSFEEGKVVSQVRYNR